MHIFLGYLVKAISIAFVFGILIFFHELGHFFIAKKTKVKVEKFSFGWGPALIKFKRGETEYTISLIPVGGYVKLAGEGLNESKGKEGEFYSKSPRQRIGILAAGPIMSFALAFVIFYVVAMSGIPILSTKAKVGGLIENYPAIAVGIEKGDLVTAINNEPVKSWEQMTNIVRGKADKEITIEVNRNGKVLSFNVTPKLETTKNQSGGKQKIGMIGISPEIIMEKFNPLMSFYEAAKMVGNTTYMTVGGIVQLIRGQASAKDLGGPILIARVTARLSEEGFLPVLNFAGFISVVLGIMNLLPIPLADGGIIVLFLIEIFRKKPVSEKSQLIFQNVGIALIVGIILFATYNDITRDYSKILPKSEKALEQNGEK